MCGFRVLLAATIGLALAFDAQAALVSQWTFNDGTASDAVGGADGTLVNGAQIADGRLLLNGVNQYLDAPLAAIVGARTLVVWATPANLAQRGGGLLTIERPSVASSANSFDAIVFGEQNPAVWMSGSEFFNRTQSSSSAPAETVVPPAEVMIAITYDASNNITIYRDGALYQASYQKGSLQTYSSTEGGVLLGLRHTAAAPQVGSAAGSDPYFAGSIDEARIYDEALDANALAALHAAGPTPVPVPGAAGFMVFGLAGLIARARARRIAV